MKMIIIVLLFFTVSMFSQDSTVYYHNDTVLGRTLYDDYFENHYNSKDSLLYSCEKLNDTWYYYRADTVYQKLEWTVNGHIYYTLENGQWIKGIECIVYDTPTIFSINQSPIRIYSSNKSVFIRADQPIKELKVFDINGQLIKQLNPYSSFVQLQFIHNAIVLISIDGQVYKHTLR